MSALGAGPIGSQAIGRDIPPSPAVAIAHGAALVISASLGTLGASLAVARAGGVALACRAVVRTGSASAAALAGGQAVGLDIGVAGPAPNVAGEAGGASLDAGFRLVTSAPSLAAEAVGAELAASADVAEGEASTTGESGDRTAPGATLTAVIGLATIGRATARRQPRRGAGTTVTHVPRRPPVLVTQAIVPGVRLRLVAQLDAGFAADLADIEDEELVVLQLLEAA